MSIWHLFVNRRKNDRQISELQDQVNCIDGKVDKLNTRLTDHEERESKKFDEMMVHFRENNENVKMLAEGISGVNERLDAVSEMQTKHMEQTKPVLDIHRDVVGAGNVGKWVRDFVKWLVWIGAPIAISYQSIVVLIDRFKG